MRTSHVVAIAVLIGATAAIAQSPVRPGRWEVTMQMEMPGSPAKMPEMKSTQCVTPEQVKDPANSLPSGPGKDCKVSDYKQSGNTVTWKMTCAGAQPSTSTGELTFTDDTYTGAMKTNMAGNEMTMKLAGKRLGDCKK